MILAVIDYTPVLTGIISFIFGGGLVSAAVAMYKVKPEAGQIVVSAAQGALLVQTGVIENLKREIERLNNEILTLKAENGDLRKRIDQILDDQSRHDVEIRSLQPDSFGLDLNKDSAAK